MSLAEDLARAAGAAAAQGKVAAVLAAEPDGARAYLVALGEAEKRKWLVLDGAFAPVAGREEVRSVASIVVLCELAGELAAGGRVDELRSRLAELRITEGPPGIEAAEEAALALERVLGTPPIVASPGYLDAVGAATRALEEALGEHGSPFASSLASASGTVEAFVADVQARHAVPLR